MNTKKKYIILSLGILAIGISLVGITFAWYSYSNAESKANASGKTEKPSVVFSQTEYIETTNIMPILDQDRYNYGTNNSFIINVSDRLKYYEIALQINLVDIEISPELKINNFKYELLENDIIVSSGNFSNLKENNLEILPNKVLDISTYPYAYNYKLIIWLSEDGSDQNNLMDKEFKARINVISATKKK